MKRFIFFILLTLSLLYLIIAFKTGRPLRQIIKKEPIFEKYMSDMNCYLKTYYLIEKKVPFYQAYALAEKGDAGSDSFPGEIWGWKTPFLFYFWKLIPGTDGRSIYWSLVLLIFSLPWLSFLIGRELVGEKYAFLSPLLVWPYFLLPLQDLTFIQMEWWALIFFFWGFYFLLKKKFFWSSLFFTFSLFSRELFSFHLFFLFLVILFKKLKSKKEKAEKKRLILSILLPFILISLFYLLIHVPQVGRYENLVNFISWTRSEGKSISWLGIQKTLAFNSLNYYFLTRFFPFRISLVVSTFSLFYLYWKEKRMIYFLFLACFLPFFILQFKPGIMTEYHDYWGIYYVPFTLLSFPVVIKLIKLILKK